MPDLAERIEALSPLKRALLTIERLEERLERAEEARREPVAVIGVGCRFPGGGDGPDAFWRLLVEGLDATVEVPPDRYERAPGRLPPGGRPVRPALFRDRPEGGREHRPAAPAPPRSRVGGDGGRRGEAGPARVEPDGGLRRPLRQQLHPDGPGRSRSSPKAATGSSPRSGRSGSRLSRAPGRTAPARRGSLYSIATESKPAATSTTRPHERERTVLCLSISCLRTVYSFDPGRVTRSSSFTNFPMRSNTYSEEVRV